MENDTKRTTNKIYYLPSAEKKITMSWLMEKRFFWSANKITNENVIRIAAGQRDDYTTDSSLDYD